MRQQQECGITEEALKTELFERISNLTLEQTKALLDKTSNCPPLDYCGNESNRISPLSAREREVLILVANGYTRKGIAECLGIAANTAARHITNIYSKLDISSVAEATQIAIHEKLLYSE